MSSYLLDTNHAGSFFRGNDALRIRLRATPANFGLCRPSIGELWFMVHNSTRVAVNQQKLESVLTEFHIWEYDAESSAEFGKIRAELRKSGTPIPAIDVQIAAIARVHGLVLLTADQHFQNVSGLMVENWLTPPTAP